MTMDWSSVVRKLRTYPPRVHRLLPPCSDSRLRVLKKQLGQLPDCLSAMLEHFNGGRLFIAENDGGELLAIFGVTVEPPLPSLDWTRDWHIDVFTPKWRAAGDGRESQFAIAMMNYGGLIILEGDMVREWDTAQKRWRSQPCSFSEWMDGILREGDQYLNES